ncbi:Ubiquitin-protein ligase-like protein [Theobroma cacao]|uniref:Ubiquitin-protein ligase-like protein n=1 Tax=Theobroma cacao TaxID=3641 RepID=A0A061FQ86_THECC|nr:Ubiquitin-protein ligase-like protein [Theobroma cacao]
MTNNDLVLLTQNFANLVEFAFLGCKLLNSDARCIISSEWPGLISIHLKDCKEVTRSSVCSLFNCTALEDLLLRHNGTEQNVMMMVYMIRGYKMKMNDKRSRFNLAEKPCANDSSFTNISETQEIVFANGVTCPVFARNLEGTKIEFKKAVSASDGLNHTDHDMVSGDDVLADKVAGIENVYGNTSSTISNVEKVNAFLAHLGIDSSMDLFLDISDVDSDTISD